MPQRKRERKKEKEKKKEREKKKRPGLFVKWMKEVGLVSPVNLWLNFALTFSDEFDFRYILKVSRVWQLWGRGPSVYIVSGTTSFVCSLHAPTSIGLVLRKDLIFLPGLLRYTVQCEGRCLPPPPPPPRRRSGYLRALHILSIHNIC